MKRIVYGVAIATLLATPAMAQTAAKPTEVKATVDARAIDITPYRAYVAQFPAVALKSGLVSMATLLKWGSR